MTRSASVEEAVRSAAAELRAAGIPPDEAALDARLLAQHVLAWDAGRFLASRREPAPATFVERYQTIVARRSRREPLAYIVGVKDFWKLPFEVSPDVLIPRPETELLVELALRLMPGRGEAPHVADSCTGSGCVAVALAHERPDIQVTATDISPAALSIARRNAARHGVTDRIRFETADLLDGLDAPLFDLVVSNPPYVAERDRATLQPEIREFEPPLALFGGDDGLSVVRRLVTQSASRLKGGGHLIVELGADQARAFERLISSAPQLRMVDVARDLQGIPRAGVARRDS